MTAFPYRCGRLDEHEPHEWRSHDTYRPRSTYHCAGHVLTEMQRTEFDDADDAAEQAAMDERRGV